MRKFRTCDITELPLESATYRSLDPTIASVDATGLIRGLAIGTARLRVTSGGLSTEGNVRVY